MDVCLPVLKESEKGSTVYIDHIPYYLLGLPHALFSDNLINFSRYSCICCIFFCYLR